MAQRRFTLIRPRPSDAADSHEQLFVERYSALLAAARRVTGGDREAVEDLLQDAYVQFVVVRPDLSQVEHLDAYLATLVRHLYVSRMRLKANQQQLHVEIADYDSADVALHLSGTERLIARDALARVCAHVGTRKAISRTASALALRFFHGFYPSEIAQIARVSVRVVHVWLSRARAEARTALANPDHIRPFDGRRSAESLPPIGAEDPAEILACLQSALFATRRPPCPSPAAIAKWYGPSEGTPLGVETLSHVASCRPCLDHITTTLGLPPLDERSSLDPPPDRPSDGGGGLPPAASLLRKGARRGRDVVEHRPKQLRVSVNGLPVGVLAVESAWNQVRWTVRVDEPLAFAELHSEQGIRMVLLPLSPAPSGDLVQRLQIALSDERSVTLAVDFSERHPAVTVEYADPSLAASPMLDADAAGDEVGSAAADPQGPSWWRSSPRLSVGPFSERRLGWRWGALALVGVSLAVVTTLWMRTDVSRSAVRLLDQAAAVERSEVSSDQAARRRITFMVQRVDGGSPDVTRRIETWRQGSSPLGAVRVFDRTGALVAGQWTDSASASTTRPLGVLDDVWKDGLSVAAFRDRYLPSSSCATSMDPQFYAITCDRIERTGGLRDLFPLLHAQSVSAPSRAELVLRRPDMHALKLVLTLRIDEVPHRVILEEAAWTRMPVRDVPPGAFAPDAPPPAASTTAPTVPRAVPVASSSLEMRLVELVDRLAGAQAVAVNRGPGGALSVTGLIDTGADKRALLDAVQAFDRDRLVRTDVQTFAEAAARTRSTGSVATASPPRAEMRDLPAGPPPFEAYLRSVRPSVDPVATVRELAPRVVSAARGARREARALRALAQRYPADTVGALDADGRAAWISLVTRRAAAALASITVVSEALAPYLDIPTAHDEAPADTLDELAHRLDHESAVIDDAISYAFTASDRSEPQGAVSPDIGHHVHVAAHDAAAIAALVERFR